ncbi:MAG: hypothetical protein ACNFW9_05245 [Candidatus Kerfeldbacteria bacterium]
MYWANFFHIYQPPNWSPQIIKKVTKESYRPILTILKKSPKLKITLNISGSLTEQLALQGFNDIIDDITNLAKKKQIEFTGSALYHPILPLLPTKEIIRQIQLNTEINKKYFGKIYNPKGFFSPEMAYNKKIAIVIQSLGYKWIIVDEICYNGVLNASQLNQRYQIKGTSVNIVFRNRAISDYFSFHGNPKKPQEFWDTVEKDGRYNPAIITAMDGENLGHHRKGWDIYWKKLATDKKIHTLTINSLLKKYKSKKIITPVNASWSSQDRELKNKHPYILWDDPKNQIHSLQWNLIHYTSKLLHQKTKHSNYTKARKLFDKRLASDQFWWASAKPWWSLRIIKKKTKELQEVILLVDKNNKEGINISKKIIKLATKWQSTNKFKTIADKYLLDNQNDNTRFIGGNKITN